jgi:hypothetical protein
MNDVLHWSCDVDVDVDVLHWSCDEEDDDALRCTHRLLGSLSHPNHHRCFARFQPNRQQTWMES